MRKIMKFMKDIMKFMRKFMKDIMKFMRKFMKDIMKFMRKFMKDIMKFMRKFMKDIMKFMKEILKFMRKIMKFMRKIMKFMKTKWTHEIHGKNMKFMRKNMKFMKNIKKSKKSWNSWNPVAVIDLAEVFTIEESEAEDSQHLSKWWAFACISFTVPTVPSTRGMHICIFVTGVFMSEQAFVRWRLGWFLTKWVTPTPPG